MKTYWQYSVSVNDRMISSCGKNTLSLALEAAITDAVYYQAIYPSHRIIIGGIEEICSECSNTGAIIRRHKQTRCPECRGKVPTAVINPIVFKMPDPANRISLLVA